MSSSFDAVKYGFVDSPCSPQFADDEPDGIKIALPDTFDLRVAEGAERRMLPLCVTLRFSALYVSGFDHIVKAVKVVLVDDENGEVLSGGIWRDRHHLPRKRPDIPREELAVRVATKYATVNLLEHFRLPTRNARYKVYALLEQHKSNVATLEIQAE